MVVPTIFRDSSERVLASYDWVDISNGLGYVMYYCMDTNEAAPQNILTTSTSISSFPLFHYKTSTGMVCQEEFSTSFNLPQYVKGNAIVNIPYSHDGTSMSFAILIKHNSTTIGSLAADTVNYGVGKGTAVFAASIALTPTLFKKGDELKISIECNWAKGAGTQAYVLHDPKGASVDYMTGGTIPVNSNMILAIPFRIDL